MGKHNNRTTRNFTEVKKGGQASSTPVDQLDRVDVEPETEEQAKLASMLREAQRAGSF